MLSTTPAKIAKPVTKTVAKAKAEKPAAKAPAKPEAAPAAPVTLKAAELEAAAVPEAVSQPVTLPDLTKTETGKPVETKKAARFEKRPLPFDGSKTFTWVGPNPSAEGSKRHARYGLMQAMDGSTLAALADKVPARYVSRAIAKGTIKV